MKEEELLEKIKFVDFLMDRNDMSKNIALSNFEKRLELLHNAKQDFWRTYKEAMESELSAQKILKLCLTGR